MDLAYMQALPQTGGFDYGNCLRNKALTANKGMGLQTNVQNMKTGTTICGLIFNVSPQTHLELHKLTKFMAGWRCSGCRH